MLAHRAQDTPALGLMADAGLFLFFSDRATNHQGRSEEKDILHEVLSLQTWHQREFNKTDIGPQDESEESSQHADGQE